MLSPRAMAHLGIGYGPRLAANLGIWPADAVATPVTISGGDDADGDIDWRHYSPRTSEFLRREACDSIEAPPAIEIPPAVAVELDRIRETARTAASDHFVGPNKLIAPRKQRGAVPDIDSDMEMALLAMMLVDD